MEFDTRVQHRDPKTGKVVKHTPYVMKFSRENGESFIRGNVEYYPDGSIKRDMRPKAEAVVEEPKPLKVESAPSHPVESIGPEEKQERDLGIPSEAELMSKAKRGFSKGTK
jgi:hypothetical protein